jgi:hypothetical protein
MHCVSDISTDVLHIPDLILKLYVFISFLYELFQYELKQNFNKRNQINLLFYNLLIPSTQFLEEINGGFRISNSVLVLAESKIY